MSTRTRTPTTPDGRRLNAWKQELDQGLWPKDVPLTLREMQSPAGAVSTHCAIVGARKIVDTLLEKTKGKTTP